MSDLFREEWMSRFSVLWPGQAHHDPFVEGKQSPQGSSGWATWACPCTPSVSG